jgi:hypothetical protein
VLLIGEVPICDVRQFLDLDTGRLRSPAWPDPRPGKDFIRGFGHVYGRSQNLYCKAGRAIRFPESLAGWRFGTNPGLNGFHCVSRTYQSDGHAVGSVDIILNRERHTPTGFSPSQLVEVVGNLLACPVTVPRQPLPWKGEYALVGDKVAALLLASTTAKKEEAGNVAPARSWWVTAGNPMVICMSRMWDSGSPPGTYVPVPELERAGVTVHFLPLERRGRSARVWFVKSSRNVDDDLLGRIANHFTMIHAQRECLREVLRLVIEGKIVVTRDGDATQNLQDFLKLAMSWLTRKKRFGIVRTEILDAVYAADELVNAKEKERLLRLLREIRPSLRRKLERTMSDAEELGNVIASVQGTSRRQRGTIHVEYYKGGSKKVEDKRKQVDKSFKMNVGAGATVTGVFGQGNRVGTSFNKVDKSGADPELKTALKELLKQTSEVAKHLPSDQAEQVGRDLASFAEEAVAKTPRRDLLELFGKAIVGAASIAVPGAKPIADLVGHVLGMVFH